MEEIIRFEHSHIIDRVIFYSEKHKFNCKLSSFKEIIKGNCTVMNDHRVHIYHNRIYLKLIPRSYMDIISVAITKEMIEDASILEETYA